MSEAVLTLDHVSKRYVDGDRTIEALHDVSLSVGRGELVLVVGPSGSGKTSLLGVLGGLVTPTSGDVKLLDRSLVGMRDRHRTEVRRTHVGIVFQELALVAEMSLLENVLLPIVPRGVTPSDRARALASLERFGLHGRASTPAARLSGGERQRGAIARALVNEPPVLLLDEPTAHVDDANAALVLSMLGDIVAEGRTVIATTHDLRLTEDPRVTRIVRMRGGRIVE